MTHVNEMSAHVKMLLPPSQAPPRPPRVAVKAALWRLPHSSKVGFKDGVILDEFVPFSPCKKQKNKTKNQEPKKKLLPPLSRSCAASVAGFIGRAVPLLLICC